MFKKYPSFFIVLFIIIFSGCAHVEEGFKTLWGTSVSYLEKERVNAFKKSYKCSFDECYNTILSIAKNETDLEPVTGKVMSVFLKDPVKSHIVFMDIPGNINTTEVGVFFVLESRNVYRIEVSSLSSIAKERASELIFAELDGKFESAK